MCFKLTSVFVPDVFLPVYNFHLCGKLIDNKVLNLKVEKISVKSPEWNISGLVESQKHEREE